MAFAMLEAPHGVEVYQTVSCRPFPLPPLEE